MAVVQNAIKWVDNTEELKKNLLSGVDAIYAMKDSVDRTVQSLSGQGLFQAANKVSAAIIQMGGATKLTSDEQDRANAVLDKAIAKYAAMGMTAPKAMIELRDAMKGTGDEAGGLDGMFTKLFGGFAAHVAEGMLLRDAIREVINLGKEAITDAARFEDLSKATGLSVQGIQQLSYVGAEFGVDTEQMGRGVEQLSAKLAGGDANATKAVGMLGLSIHDLLALGPQEAFLTIAEAVGKVEDPMQKNALASDLFGGKLGKQLIPMLGDLREKMDEAAKSGAMMSDETVKAAHDFEVEWTHAITHVKAMLAELIGTRAQLAKMLPGNATNPEIQRLTGGVPITQDLSQYGKGTLPIVSLVAYQGALVNASGATHGLMSDTDLLANRLAQLKTDAMDPLSASQKSHILELKSWGVSEKEIADLVHTNETAVKRFVEAHKQAETQVKAFQKAEENLIPVLTDPAWDGSIDSMLKLGGSVHDTAEYFGESEGVIKRHAEAMKVWDRIVGIESTKSVQQLDAELRQMGTAVPESFFTDMDKSAEAVIKLEHGVALTHGELTSLGETAKPSMESLYQGLTKSEKVVYQLQDAFNAMPGIMMQAFQGGGNILGAVQSLGTKITDSLFGEKGPLKGITSGLTNAVTSMTSGLGSTISGVLGKAVGGMLPIIGGLIGPALDFIMNIGGPSKDELAARDTFGKFQQQYGTLQQTIDGVGAAYAKMGKTGTEAQQDLQRALDATHVSAKAEADALAVINGKLQQGQQDTADLNAAIQKYGFSIQELGPAMQKQQLDAQAQQLMRDWTLLIGSGISLTTVNDHMAASMNTYLQTAKLTGQEVPQAMQPILQKMIDQGLLTDSNGKKITDLKDIGVSFSMTMSDGFKLIADKLQTLLEKLGLVPKAMEAFQTSGTDAADAVAEAMNKIPRDIETSISVNGAASGSSAAASQAVANASSHLDEWYALPFDYRINTTFDDWVKATYGAMGGLVTDRGIQYLAAGGNVLPFMPRGTDTVPAMLTPGEMVITPRQQAMLFRQANGGGAGGGSVVDFSAMRAHFSSLQAEVAGLRGDLARRIPQLTALATSAAVAQVSRRRA